MKNHCCKTLLLCFSTDFYLFISTLISAYVCVLLGQKQILATFKITSPTLFCLFLFSGETKLFFPYESEIFRLSVCVRESVCVGVWARERESVWERERECVRVCFSRNERENICLYFLYVRIWGRKYWTTYGQTKNPLFLPAILPPPPLFYSTTDVE